MIIIPRIGVGKARKDGASENGAADPSLLVQKRANDRELARLGRALRITPAVVRRLNAYACRLAALQVAGFLSAEEAAGWAQQAADTAVYGAAAQRRGCA